MGGRTMRTNRCAGGHGPYYACTRDAKCGSSEANHPSALAAGRNGFDGRWSIFGINGDGLVDAGGSARDLLLPVLKGPWVAVGLVVSEWAGGSDLCAGGQ